MLVANYGTLPVSPAPPKRRAVGLVVVASLACLACVVTLGHLMQGTGAVTSLMSFDDQVTWVFLVSQSLGPGLHAVTAIVPFFCWRHFSWYHGHARVPTSPSPSLAVCTHVILGTLVPREGPLHMDEVHLLVPTK